jgi:hypothetical protein
MPIRQGSNRLKNSSGSERRSFLRSTTSPAASTDGELRARCCAKAMQHAPQLLALPIGLDRHTEDNPSTIIVSRLSLMACVTNTSKSAPDGCAPCT